MAKKRTKKQKIRTQARKQEKAKDESTAKNEFLYSLSNEAEEAPKQKKEAELLQKSKKMRTSDRLVAAHSNVVAESRYSILVAGLIFAVYLLIFLLMR